MFDQQLTFDGGAEDVAPVTKQDRLFAAPTTIRGQTAIDTSDSCLTECLTCDAMGRTKDHRGFRTDMFAQYVLCPHRLYTQPIGPQWQTVDAG